MLKIPSNSIGHHPFQKSTGLGVGSLTQSEEMSHFDILETSGLCGLQIIQDLQLATSQREFRRPRGEQGPRWTHTYGITAKFQYYFISTLHSLNSLLGSADLGHFTGNGRGELTDLSVGSAADRTRDTSSSKLGDGQHWCFLITALPSQEWNARHYLECNFCSVLLFSSLVSLSNILSITYSSEY